MAAAARYPRSILVSCPVPWDEREAFIEELFREQVRRVVAAGFDRLYVFGTGGEGYAVDSIRFRQVVTAFLDEAGRVGAHPMVGAIAPSTALQVERLTVAYELGARAFQISLPSWGRLTDDEVLRFFDDICGRFPDSTFLHYNLGRTGRLLGGADYRRLVDRIPNLVATKIASGSATLAYELMRDAPELAHHFDVDAFTHGATFGPASLLASYAPMSPRQCHALFEAGVRGDTAELSRLQHGVVALGAELWSVPAPGPHMDGAYDKMLVKLGLLPEFPLRLLSPYEGFTDDDFRRCRTLMERRFPDWLPAS